MVHYVSRWSSDPLISAGIDLDWEYPQADDRGGQPSDTANYVALARDLRSALGRKGLSMTLPTSYWYLQHFDVASLQASVDWFNFMTYVGQSRHVVMEHANG